MSRKGFSNLAYSLAHPSSGRLSLRTALPSLSIRVGEEQEMSCCLSVLIVVTRIEDGRPVHWKFNTMHVVWLFYTCIEGRARASTRRRFALAVKATF